MIRTLTAAAIAATTALFATSALAQDPPAPQPVGTPGSSGTAAQTSPDTSVDNSGVSAAVLLGYGFNDVFKLGFGARVGYTLPMHLYIGGTFVYHLGTSTDIGNGTSVSENIMYFGGEVGYEIPAGPVMIRPYAGIGLAVVKIAVPGLAILGGGSDSASSSDVYIAPGATLIYPVTGSFGIGVDARFVIVSGANAFSTFLTAQYHF